MTITLTRRRVALAVAAVAVVLTATACGAMKLAEPFNDAPRGQSFENGADTITMPDGFSNLATKCVNGVRYTVVYHGDSPYGVVSTLLDPACNGITGK